MTDQEKMKEIERLLNEIKSSEQQAAVTAEVANEVAHLSQEKGERNPLKWAWDRPFKTGFLILLIMMIALPIVAIYMIKNASTFKESKTAVIESIQNLNELATAEAYGQAIVDRQDNVLLGKELGINLPGTKRHILIVIPGTIKAGVQLGQVTEEHITLNEDEKTATLVIPKADFIGETDLDLKEAELFSYEGFFRMKPNLEEGFELADEAKKLIREQAKANGLLERAEENAQKSLTELFALIGYEVIIEMQE